ncbi:MAG: B12-binding domain-containing radical SAM protein [Candidatus Muiribacteriota bacterium]
MNGVLLINPPIVLKNYAFLEGGVHSGPPLGLMNIVTHLKKKEIKIDFLDMVPLFKNRINFTNVLNSNEFSKYLNNKKISKSLEFFLIYCNKIINNYKANLIGFTVHNKDELEVVLSIAKFLKKKHENIKIVLGGFYITTCDKNQLLKFTFIDYFILGYGEESIEKLIMEEKVKNIPGLIYKDKNNNYIINKTKKIPDINNTPPININLLRKTDYEIKVNGKKGMIIPYQFGRGCNGGCKFCSNFGYFSQLNNNIEYKSPKKVLKDILFFKEKHKSDYFIICDDAVNSDNKRLNAILEELIDKNIKIKWGSFCKPCGINKKLAKKLRKTGCKYLVFGCESGSKSILKRMNKGISIQEMEKTLKNCHKQNILNFAFFIIGYPGETLKDYILTLHFIIKNSVYLYGVEPFFYKKQEGSRMYYQEDLKNLKGVKKTTFLKLHILKLIQLIFISSRNIFRLLKKDQKLIFKYLKMKHNNYPFVEIYFNYHSWINRK